MNSDSGNEERPGIVGPIINASYPRSGHRFLRGILSSYFGKEFVFYEPYVDKVTSADKLKRSIDAVNFVKTHDFQLAGRNVLVDRFPHNRKYLVQIRHPLESIASYYEFSLRHGSVLVDDRTAWDIFLREKLEYWKSFCELWVIGEDSRSLLVNYDDLCTSTLATVVRVIGFMVEAPEINSGKLEQILAHQDFLQYVGDTSSRKRERRQLQSFRYYDHERFRELEADLLEDFLRPAGLKPLF